jgi:ABC-type amino acid transport substrate-binding protein
MGVIEMRHSGYRRLLAWLIWEATAFISMLAVASDPSTPTTLEDSSAQDRPWRMVYGGDEHFPPYEYLDENGKAMGLNVDLIRAVARARANR